jgi:outer membrane protein assembly factor BamB
LALFGQTLYKLGGSGDLSKNRLKHRVGAMYISTAVVSGDYLYTYNNVGVPSCFDWKTGEDLWKSQIDKRPGGKTAWGSPIIAGGKLYITDQAGATSVFETGPKYVHLAANELRETTNASIAVSQGNLFIRTHKHLWCIGQSN